MTRRVAVIGPSNSGAHLDALAYEAGKLLGQAGWLVYTGGLGGVMEAALKGAREAGALTVGVLPGADASEANPHVAVPLATGMGEARNIILIRSVDAVLAIGKGYGTLSEIGFTLRVGKPLVLLESWDGLGPDAQIASTPDEAVNLLTQVASADRWA